MKKLLSFLLLSLGFMDLAYADLKNNLVDRKTIATFEGLVNGGIFDSPVITSFSINSSGQLRGSYVINQINANSYNGSLHHCIELSAMKLSCTWKDMAGAGKFVVTFSSDFSSFSGTWSPSLTGYSNNQIYSWNGRRMQEYATKKPETKNTKPKKVIDDDKVFSAASGSGFAVTPDGYVITNYHVIKGCTDVYIHDKGNSILSTIVTFDPNNDIALLKGNFKPKNFYPLSRESTKLLTEVYVAGHPFGRDISTTVKVTRGIVSSLTGVANNFSNLQIDASLQPGNSGGPIMNDKGNVIGVAVAKLDLDTIVEDYGVVPENVNFGVKANVVINIMESENIKLPKPNLKPIPMSDLSEMITDGTYYLSCWMTMAQINKMRETKVIFKSLN